MAHILPYQGGKKKLRNRTPEQTNKFPMPGKIQQLFLSYHARRVSTFYAPIRLRQVKSIPPQEVQIFAPEG